MHTELCGSFYGCEWIGVETVGDDEECQSLNFVLPYMWETRGGILYNIYRVSVGIGMEYRH